MILAIVCCFGLAIPAMAVSITVDGAPQSTYAVIYNGSTYVPLRAGVMLLTPDARIEWIDGCAEIETEDLLITARPGDYFIQANDRFLYAPEGVKNVDDRVLIPLRALSVAFGATVEWEASTKTVYMELGQEALAPGAEVYGEEGLYWLSRIIEAEAGGEPFLGKVGVGNVVMNRVASREFPDSIYDVIFDRNGGVQFEPVLNGTIENEPSEDSILAAKLCLEGASPVSGSLFFLNPDIAQSKWIMENCTHVITIGHHAFYI